MGTTGHYGTEIGCLWKHKLGKKGVRALSEDNPTKSFSGAIPEFFYDLIARIPAGILFIVLVLGNLGLLKFCDLGKLSSASAGYVTALLMLLIGAGYWVGIILHVFTALLGRCFNEWTWRLDSGQRTIIDSALIMAPFDKLGIARLDYCRAQGKTSFKKCYGTDPNALYFVAHYFLKFNNRLAETSLPKKAAEVSLCFNTFHAIVFWIIFRLVRSFYCLGLEYLRVN
jgi:hypothetical protein